MLVSVVIRTLNEERFLERVLQSVTEQSCPDFELETVIVDSGSTDATLSIAHSYGCRITHINQAEFSFGRSLNIGCEFASGEIFVFLSGHCVPTSTGWLVDLIAPLREEVCQYVYGRQLGWGPTKYSESRVFLKYFPAQSFLPQDGFFANNANAAMLRTVWNKYRFDEALTGLEDMHLAKRMVSDGLLVGYCGDAAVHHIHDETWQQVKNRYEREGLALSSIMPEASLTFTEFIKCTVRSIAKDSYAALRGSVLIRQFRSIVLFRTLQYWGSYSGTRLARMISRSNTKSYFYPDRHFTKPLEKSHEGNRPIANESAQQSGSRQKL